MFKEFFLHCPRCKEVTCHACSDQFWPGMTPVPAGQYTGDVLAECEDCEHVTCFEDWEDVLQHEESD